MAITQAMATSFKTELLGGTHVLPTDTLKMALFTSSATLGAATTVYSATNEISGSGYTAGGENVTGLSVTSSGTTAYIDFNDVVWASATITARGALLYNSSKANRAIAVYNFGSDQSSSGGDFTVVVPAPAAGTAVVRIA